MDPAEAANITEGCSDGAEGSCKQVAQTDKYEKLRLWSALSFAVMLIPVGIPLWWKTTEVYRAPLPFERINRLDTRGLRIAYTISVYTQFPTTTNKVIDDLSQRLSSSNLYRVKIRPHKIELDNVTRDSVEAADWLHPNEGCQLLLVQLPRLDDGLQVLVSSKRIVYFTSETNMDILHKMITDWLLHNDDLEDQILSIVEPDELKERVRLRNALLSVMAHGGSASPPLPSNNNKLRRLRASPTPGYDVIFTLINSDPENVHLVWDIESAIHLYFQPLLDQIKAVREHFAKSQWLYLVDLSEQMRPHDRPHPDSKSRSKPATVIPYSQLPHIITPLEKKLGSGVSKNACVHMIAYVTGCREAPVSLLSANGESVSGMVSPEWGAIQLINPDEEHCTPVPRPPGLDNHTATTTTTRRSLEPVSNRVMAVFVTQFHALLGVAIKDKIEGAWAMDNIGGGGLLRDWQLDALYTMRTVEQITLATLTLQSLSKLLGEISNIVINEEVAMSVAKAVDGVEAAVGQLKSGNLSRALAQSTEAFLSAEMAFTNPSLLALLYFPDDQKYAVYIPLFLPIMIPVLMSLKKIYNWILESSLKKTSSGHLKSE